MSVSCSLKRLTFIAVLLTASISCLDHESDPFAGILGEGATYDRRTQVIFQRPRR